MTTAALDEQLVNVQQTVAQVQVQLDQLNNGRNESTIHVPDEMKHICSDAKAKGLVADGPLPEEVVRLEEVELKRLKAAHVKLGNAVEQNAEVFGEGGKEQIPDALRALLDEHGSGPFDQEDARSSNAIDKYVVKVFQEITGKSESVTLLWKNATNVIQEMKKAKEVSIKLNTKDIQADRTDLEKTRAAQVCKMWDKFEERKKVVECPDEVTPLLATKRKEMVAECDTWLKEQEDHQKRCKALAEVKEALRKKIEEHSAEDGNKFKGESEKRISQVLEARQKVKDALDQAQKNLDDARSGAMRLDQLDRERMQANQEWECRRTTADGEIKKISDDMTTTRRVLSQSKQRHALLNACKDWLEGTYALMRTTMAKRRQDMEEAVRMDNQKYCELLKKMVKDYGLRMQKTQEALSQTATRKNELKLEAKRLERVPNAAEKCETEKEKLRQVKDEEKALKKELKELEQARGKFQKIIGNVEQNTKAIVTRKHTAWVQSIFFNREDYKTLDEQEEKEATAQKDEKSGSWLSGWRKRITGKSAPPSTSAALQPRKRARMSCTEDWENEDTPSDDDDEDAAGCTRVQQKALKAAPLRLALQNGVPEQASGSDGRV